MAEQRRIWDDLQWLVYKLACRAGSQAASLRSALSQRQSQGSAAKIVVARSANPSRAHGRSHVSHQFTPDGTLGAAPALSADASKGKVLFMVLMTPPRLVTRTRVQAQDHQQDCLRLGPRRSDSQVAQRTERYDARVCAKAIPQARQGLGAWVLWLSRHSSCTRSECYDRLEGAGAASDGLHLPGSDHCSGTGLWTLLLGKSSALPCITVEVTRRMDRTFAAPKSCPPALGVSVGCLKGDTTKTDATESVQCPRRRSG